MNQRLPARLTASLQDDCELYREWQRTRDPRIRDRFIMSVSLFIVQRSRRFRRVGLDHDELFQEGVLGALQAFERFDPDHGVRFVTYARWWIDQAMRRFSARTRTIVSSADLKSANHPGAHANEFKRAIRSVPLTDDEGRDLGLYKSDRDDEESLDVTRGVERLRSVIERAGLSPVERWVIDTRWLNVRGGEQPTLAELGVRRGRSRERMRQLEARALDKIIRLFEAEHPNERIAHRLAFDGRGRVRPAAP